MSTFIPTLPLLLFLSLLSLFVGPVVCQVGSIGVFPNSSDVSELWEQNFNAMRTGGVVSSVMDSAIDPNDGSLVVVGYATGNLLSHVSVGGYEAFVVKLDPRSGQIIWSRWYATAQDDIMMGVCIDAAGNVFVTGNTAGYMGGQTSLGNWDVFVVKLTADGTQLWIHQLGTASYEFAGNCVVDVYGQLYFIGVSQGGYLSNPVLNYVSSIFLMAMASADGSKVWGRNLGASSGSQYLGVNPSATYGAASTTNYINTWVQGGRGLSIVNPIANVSTTPILILSCLLDSGSAFPDAPLPSAGGYDSVVAGYYSNNGSIVWSQRYASNGDDIIYGTATDSSGATYITGYTTSNLDGGLFTALQDIFVGKVSITGKKLWTRLYGTTLGDIGTDVTVDNAGGVYVTGMTQTTYYISLDHSVSMYSQTFANNPSNLGNAQLSGFLSKFDSDGARLWTDLITPSMPFTEASNDCPSLTPSTISIDLVSQQIYLAGKKSGYLSSDPLQYGFSASDLFDDETFTMAATQNPTNCTLQQFDTLLAQVNALLLGL